MAQTILIGYEVKSGTILRKDTGEMIPYSNRMIKLITDSGADPNHIGFDFFEEKIKLIDLARYLGVREDDNTVNQTLNNLIHKPVELTYAPRNGSLAVVGFKPVKNSS